MEGQAPNIEELLKNIRHQLSLYRQLVDVLRAEKDHIIGARIKEMRESTYSKEAILDEIHREEFRRKRWVGAAAAALGERESEITIELLIQRLAPSQHESIFSIKQALLHMVKKAKEMNDDNRALVESALRDMQEMKRSVLGLSGDRPQMYGPKGSLNSSPQDRGARLLSKEA